MLTEQQLVCGICKNPETCRKDGSTRTLSVDHDHLTGKVRGLLCHRCNAGLGYFRDNIDYLSAAIEWITK